MPYDAIDAAMERIEKIRTSGVPRLLTRDDVQAMLEAALRVAQLDPQVMLKILLAIEEARPRTRYHTDELPPKQGVHYCEHIQVAYGDDTYWKPRKVLCNLENLKPGVGEHR